MWAIHGPARGHAGEFVRGKIFEDSARLWHQAEFAVQVREDTSEHRARRVLLDRLLDRRLDLHQPSLLPSQDERLDREEHARVPCLYHLTDPPGLLDQLLCLIERPIQEGAHRSVRRR